jgi:hypothetical protein
MEFLVSYIYPIPEKERSLAPTGNGQKGGWRVTGGG